MTEQAIAVATEDEIGTPHRVVWEIRPGYVRGEVICDAGPHGWCHLTCPQGCESFDLRGGHAHQLVYGADCHVCLWINDDYPTASYHGPKHQADSGPIEVQWEGDYYSWRYPGGESDD